MTQRSCNFWLCLVTPSVSLNREGQIAVVRTPKKGHFSWQTWTMSTMSGADECASPTFGRYLDILCHPSCFGIRSCVILNLPSRVGFPGGGQDWQRGMPCRGWASAEGRYAAARLPSWWVLCRDISLSKCPIGGRLC